MCVQNFTYMYISFHFPQRCHMWFTLPLCVSLQKSDQIFDLLPLAVLDWNSLSPLLSLVYSVCLSVCLSNCLFLSLFSPFFTIYHLLFVTDILSLSLSSLFYHLPLVVLYDCPICTVDHHDSCHAFFVCRQGCYCGSLSHLTVHIDSSYLHKKKLTLIFQILFLTARRVNPQHIQCIE